MNISGKIPSQQNRYKIGDMIGQGGVTNVYSGYDNYFRRDAAIKVVRQDLFSLNMMQKLAFQFNYYVPRLAQISHQNIDTIYDSGNINGLPFFAEGLLNGIPLAQYLGQPINEKQAAASLAPVARAISFAHQNGCLHLDLKPANIFLINDQIPIITDLGVYQMFQGIIPIRTNSAVPTGIGTPEYMSPEIIMGQNVDKRSDVYSLGIIFYEMLTGNKPFVEIRGMTVQSQQVNSPLPNPENFGVNLSNQTLQVLSTALSKNPNNRFPDMASFASALESIASMPNAQQKSFMVPSPDKVSIENYGAQPSKENRMNMKDLLNDKKKRNLILSLGGGFIILIALILIITSSMKSSSLRAQNTQKAISDYKTMTQIQYDIADQMLKTAEQANIQSTQAAETSIAEMMIVKTTEVPIANSPVAQIPSTPVAIAANTSVAAENKGTYVSQNPADGTVYSANATFDLTYVIQNDGNNTWDANYSIRFLNGTNISTGQKTEFYIPIEVPAGKQVTFTIPCTAPSTEGSYTMGLTVTDAAGNGFLPVTIKINVGDTAAATDAAIVGLTATSTLAL